MMFIDRDVESPAIAVKREMVMQTTQGVIIIAVVAVAVIGIALAAWYWNQRRRSEELQERFGPEYDQALHRSGDRGRAEKELESRQKRVEKLNIRPLSDPDRTRFEEAWNSTQARFVDDPSGALLEADRLVTEVMHTRGYPMGEFEQRAADISVDHPQMVEQFRAAHAIAGKADRGEASTDDMRQGLLHYRALFEDLLKSPAGQTASPRTMEARR
jgi:hypothetical protein